MRERDRTELAMARAWKWYIGLGVVLAALYAQGFVFPRPGTASDVEKTFIRDHVTVR